MFLALLACANPDYIRLYHRQDKAPSLDWATIGALDHLGPTLIDQGTNFGLFSEHADRIDLLLFEDPESTEPINVSTLTRFGDVWNVYLEGVGPGQTYGYVAWGSNWVEDKAFLPGSVDGFLADVDEEGNRYNPNKLLIDPYSKALHRDHDWAKGSAASGVDRDQATWAAAAKSVVTSSEYVWSDHESDWMALRASGDHPGHDWNDLIVYEAQLKGLTMDAASNQWGVEHFGTFAGLGEGASYLTALGVTAVELLPTHEKSLEGGYWGYNNLSFFAKEVTYSAAWLNGEPPVATIDEFKGMVDALHQAGVEVLLDVVFNHTGEGGLWRTKLFFDDPDGDFLCDPAAAANLDSQEVASLLSFRGIDSPAYYVLENANQGYWDGSTGVGNQTRANHTPMRRLILDSLRYGVEELHVDGYRFDLAAVLGEPDGAASQYWTDAAGTVLQEIADDPVLLAHNTRLIAEPWGLAYDASTNYPASTVADGVAFGEWNGNFRDWWRVFLNDDASALNTAQGAVDGGGVLTASAARYDDGRRPYHSVNFITSHDGFTMFDLFSYDEKQNGCGPLNPICCEDACSSWCDAISGESNNHSRNWANAWEKRQMMRNAYVGLLFSHGTPMLLGGDEWMRTQYGNNNAYSTLADNEWAWYRWGEWTSTNHNNVFRHRMFDFVAGLVRFRLDHTAALSPSTYDGGMPLSWKDPSGADATSDTWAGRAIGQHYSDAGGAEPELFVAINGAVDARSFSLPSGTSWALVIDTQSWYDLPGTTGEPTGWFDENTDADPLSSANLFVAAPVPVSGAYEVMGRSIAVFEEVN